ncbi:MAG: heme lyase CcmF/NrfE family subunit [Pseudomonadota bacterium]
MIPEVGQFALSVALVVALAQGVLPIAGATTGRIRWMKSAETTSITQAILVAFAFIALMRSFIVSDFTVLNVVQNSSVLKPLIFKVAGTWGSHEGSLLLWTLILSLFGASVALFGANIPQALKARALSVQAWISVGFLSFMLFTSNPFERVFPPPLEGQDLNPLLQDVGLALHPPLLYLGYVGLSIVFSFAVAALIEGRVDPAWARWVRPWTLAAWAFLTAGIALGSWWAYYELGWGGWWFWDPVENVSFMPWLVATALLHSAIVSEKRDAFKSWTILLAILAFSLSLLGTFIVRSGLLTSVHAFAVDPERGIYILALLGITIGGSLTLYAVRAPDLKPGGLFAPLSRETGLIVNNLILSVATGTVLVGTLYPLFLEAITGDKVSIGPPFYNVTFVPLMLPLVAVMGIGPFLSWKRADLAGVLDRLKFAFIIMIIAALAVWYWDTEGPVLALIAIAFAVWLAAATINEWADRVQLFRVSLSTSWRRAKGLPRAAYGMTLAHLGIAIAIFGFVGSTAWQTEVIVSAKEGTTVTVAGFELRFDGVRAVQGPNYVSRMGEILVTRDGQPVATLRPERRAYPLASTTTTEAAIRSRPMGDLLATISEPAAENAEGTWTLRVVYQPLVGFIWLAAAAMVAGAIVSLSDRRLRVGAPRKTLPAEARPAVVPAE